MLLVLFGLLLRKKDHNHELDEPQRSTIQNKLLRSARDGTDAAINYTGFSINPKLQANYEHFRTVREIIIKNHKHKNVQTQLLR